MPTTVHRIARVLFSIGFLGFLMFRLDFSATIDSLSRLPLFFVMEAAGLSFISIWISAVKWRVLLPDYDVGVLTRMNFISLFYSLVLPGQLFGDSAKGYFMVRRGAGTDRVVASIFIDRITGLVGLLLVALTGILLSEQQVGSRLTSLFGACIVLSLGILFALRLRRVFSAVAGCFEWIGCGFPFLEPAATKTIEIIVAWRRYLHDPTVLLRAVGLGIVFQLLCVGTQAILARGMAIAVAPADWCWIFGIVSIALLLPITFGGLGLREGTLIGLLRFFQVSDEKALALSLAIFVLQVLGAIVGAALNTQKGIGGIGGK